MIASLPMYERPENRAAHDLLWRLIRDGLRARGIATPETLDREIGFMDILTRDDLVLGQICNLPWRARFRDHVTLIGASDYGLPGAPAGYYYSLFVVRQDDPAQTPEDAAAYRFAYNDGLSNSGYGAAQLWAAERGFQFRPTLASGAHVNSLHAVVAGQADIAALDAQTFRMLRATDPLARKVRVIGRTAATPGISFVTRPRQDPAPYFAAIQDAIADLPAAEAELLGLQGIVALPLSAYEIPLPQPPEALPK